VTCKRIRLSLAWRSAIAVNPGGIEHWKAIKTQELFADRVMPRFRSATAAESGIAVVGTA